MDDKININNLSSLSDSVFVRRGTWAECGKPRKTIHSLVPPRHVRYLSKYFTSLMKQHAHTIRRTNICYNMFLCCLQLMFVVLCVCLAIFEETLAGWEIGSCSTATNFMYSNEIYLFPMASRRWDWSQCSQFCCVHECRRAAIAGRGMMRIDTNKFCTWLVTE